MPEEGLLTRVRQATLEMPGSRKSVADFLIREGSGVANLSMAEVADLTYTSKPSLVRFAKAMGYSGWRDFRMAFVTAVKESEEGVSTVRTIDPNHPFGPEDSLGTVVSNVSALERQALLDAMDRVEARTLAVAASRVVAAKRLVFFGEKPNCFFGELLAYKLDQIGVTCAVPPKDEWADVARAMGPQDCAIVVSYSGNGPQREPASLVSSFNEVAVPVVAITNSGSNWLREHCDCVLAFEPREHIYSKISGYYSEQSVAFMLDALYSAVFSANYDKNEVIKLRSLIAYERALNQRVIDVLPY
ncbi:MAG: MurR/RpiR family transcriptional regulator [Atopobiaceae bacterium]|nr:MurR/RpiR family transcriptional regulator [Atopobiaceae bacterium]